ncbi:MAG: class I adenylate-forming enzyme family protein [Planctomycetota bacterium]|jgi:acyl-CoA synthetase (AMP-forming)/AMP-acid ligase II
MLINDFLENSAEKYPDKQAVWYKNEWRTYAQIEASANKLANYLKETGIRRGDRVAVLNENSFDYVISYFAILKTGAIAVLLNGDTTCDSLIYCLNHSGSKAIIANRKYSRHLVPAIRKSSDLKEVIIDQEDLSEYAEIGHCGQIHLQEIYDQQSDNHPSVRCINVDPACIVYTSGSTGKPKGVTLSHLNMVSNAHSIVQYLQLTNQDRAMVVLPFNYIYGKSLLNTHFCAGGSVVLDNRFVFPQVILETMKKTEVTGFSGVPSTFLILLNKSAVRKFEFESLRYVTQAGGSMAPVIQKEVAKVFAPAKLFIMYGTTEASPRLSYVNPEMLPQKWGSIGKAIANVDLFVADEKGKRLPSNETGQIVARGSNIMMGYWNDPAGTAEVLKNGLYYTNDLGWMDEDGYIYVVGRTRDIIKAGGFRVSAKEVEEALLEINEIHEVAVIGVEDEVLGEAIKAFIVLRDGAVVTEDTIANALKPVLPRYKQPKYFEFRDSLPKNEANKILKAKLVEECKSKGAEFRN